MNTPGICETQTTVNIYILNKLNVVVDVLYPLKINIKVK